MHFIPINYSDPGFNPAFSADFQLIIILNQNTFSYAVYNSGEQAFVRVSMGQPLAELFASQSEKEVFGLKYQKIVVAAETDSFCLIPDAVFNPENLLDFASFLLVKEADVILTDKIENGQNTVIFTFPEELVYKIETKFGKTAIKFAPKGWIKAVIPKQISEQRLYSFLDEDRLQILFPNGENIRFYNQFLCENADEVVYYTALVANQLKLKPEEITIVMGGRVEAESEQMLRLQQFFKNVSIFSKPDFKQENSLKEHQVVQFLGFV